MHQPVVRPSFAAWQARRGIMPWTFRSLHERQVFKDSIKVIVTNGPVLVTALNELGQATKRTTRLVGEAILVLTQEDPT